MSDPIDIQEQQVSPQTIKKKTGPIPKEIDQSVIDEVLRMSALGVPMKYVGVLNGITTHYVKRILKEQ